MKYCKKCSVSINNPVLHCPLCYGRLVSTNEMPEPFTFPRNTNEAQQSSLIFRILLFASFSVSSVCLTINIFTTTQVWWSLIVIANIAYMWLAISTAIKKQAKIGSILFLQVICLALLVLMIDYFIPSRPNWAFNYTLPGLFFTADLSISIIVIAKRIAIRDFILYFILIALLGFIPIVFIATQLSTVRWPALVSALYSLLALVSIFIFASNATKVELKKRFHI